MSEEGPLLNLTGVTKTFRLPNGTELDILRGIDLTISPGEVTAIVGRSGSGKSTLLNVLGMLDMPSGGTYICNGRDVARMGDGERSRVRGEVLGFIFQQFHLIDRRTAAENVAEPMLFAPARDRRERIQRAMALLDDVGLSERAGSMPHLLSGGEQQRVAIARALVRRPQVVLADEPTGALDEATGDRVLDLLLKLVRSERVALVLVTHDSVVASRADRILTLSDGVLEESRLAGAM